MDTPSGQDQFSAPNFVANITVFHARYQVHFVNYEYWTGSLEGIEETVRDHFLEYVGPEIGFFYRNQQWRLYRTKTHHQQHHRSLEYE